jgi:signal transduction histidine kinase
MPSSIGHAAVDDFASGIAHDFNNLLMVISGGLRLLDEHPEGDRRQRILSGIWRAVDRGASLTQRLVRPDRAEEPRSERLDLGRHIEVLTTSWDRMLRRDVEVRADVWGSVWEVSADPEGLERVLLNLCRNAVDAMPEGGRITVMAENLPSQGGAGRDMVRLAVVDDGVGMPPEVAARAFEPFYTTKPRGKGSGLGLFQARAFAERSGGSIQVESWPGEGTIVSLFLPRADVAQGALFGDELSTAIAGREGRGDWLGRAASLSTVAMQRSELIASAAPRPAA